MADDLEKFVLQYVVEIRDSISRLEQLNRKVEQTNRGAASAGQQFRYFAKGAAAELDKLVPGMSKVTLAVRAMSTEFAVAAAGVGLLAAGVAAFMRTRDDYNRQRLEGMDIGVSSARIEDYQRRLTVASRGQLSRGQVTDNIRRLQQYTYSAYTDPMQWNTQARTLRTLGISPGIRGQGPTDINTVLTQLAAQMRNMSEDQARGIAKAIGLDQDFALSLRRTGPGIGAPAMSESDIANRMEAERQLDHFNDELGRLRENFTELAHTVGTSLIPVMAGLIGYINDFVSHIPKNIIGSPEIHAARAREEAIQQRTDEIYAERTRRNRGFMGSLRGLFNAPAEHAAARKQAEAEFNRPLVGPPESAANLLQNLDQSNKTAVDTAANFNLAVNMFSGAVSTFSNAIDERQAWAAWAGELGRQNNLVGPGSALGPGGAVPTAVGLPTQYDAAFRAAAAANGVPVDLLKNIARVESHFRPGETSASGAQGLMQIMPSNFKSLGITDPFDPTQSIMGGGKLFAQMLQRAHGDVRLALMYYTGGFDRSKWGPNTMAYPDLVLGGSLQGINRPDYQQLLVQSNISSQLGIPIGQLQRGGVSSGDVDWRVRQFAAGLPNKIVQLQKELANPRLPRSERSKIMTEIQSTQRDIDLVRQYGGAAVERATIGPQDITVGEMPIIININGSTTDPNLLARVISGHLMDQFSSVSNSQATGQKK